MIQITEKESGLFGLCHAPFNQMGLFSIPAFLLEPDHFCGQQTDSERTDTAADGETTATEVGIITEGGGSAFGNFAYQLLEWRGILTIAIGVKYFIWPRPVVPNSVESHFMFPLQKAWGPGWRICISKEPLEVIDAVHFSEDHILRIVWLH